MKIPSFITLPKKDLLYCWFPQILSQDRLTVIWWPEKWLFPIIFKSLVKCIRIVVRVLQRIRTNICSYIERDLFWGIGLCNYGGWDIPWSAVCKLETRKADGIGPFECEGRRTRKASGVSLSLNPTALEPGALLSKSMRRWMSQLKQRANSSILCLFVLLRPSIDGWCSAT